MNADSGLQLDLVGALRRRGLLIGIVAGMVFLVGLLGRDGVAEPVSRLRDAARRAAGRQQDDPAVGRRRDRPQRSPPPDGRGDPVAPAPVQGHRRDEPLRGRVAVDDAAGGHRPHAAARERGSGAARARGDAARAAPGRDQHVPRRVHDDEPGGRCGGRAGARERLHRGAHRRTRQRDLEEPRLHRGRAAAARLRDRARRSRDRAGQGRPSRQPPRGSQRDPEPDLAHDVVAPCRTARARPRAQRRELLGEPGGRGRGRGHDQRHSRRASASSS